jgi:death-on-curing family protein
MSRSRIALRALASEADLDLDEALILLWDAGIDVEDPEDMIPRSRVAAARRALDLPSARDLASVEFLARATGVDVSVATSKLHDAGITPTAQGRLPRGSLAKARKVLGVSAAALTSHQTSTTATVRQQPAEYFELPTVGRPETVTYLTAEEVEGIHWKLVEDFAGSSDPVEPPGVRDRTMLESATFRPQTSNSGVLKYPTVPMAAAALFHSLVLNHAFHNGNKRTALVATLVFLERNNYILETTDSALFRFVIRIAQHDLVGGRYGADEADREVYEISRWICDNARPTRSEERPMSFRDLRRILVRYACNFTPLTGNRMLITRNVTVGRLRRVKPLKSHIWYGGEGREVDRNTLHKVRRDLWLDEEHGYDSSVFYEGRQGVGEFIAKYRLTLNRLAKL